MRFSKFSGTISRIFFMIISKTNYLLGGEDIGPSKLTRANDLNVKIISIEEFLEMTGIIIFIYGLLLALVKRQKKLSFKFSIASD